jgi:hypothetical protein
VNKFQLIIKILNDKINLQKIMSVLFILIFLTYMLHSIFIIIIRNQKLKKLKWPVSIHEDEFTLNKSCNNLNQTLIKLLQI